jgi:hypothetical protein
MGYMQSGPFAPNPGVVDGNGTATIDALAAG